MRYVFFGTPRISAVILERLLAAGMPPLALVCNPDRPVGRKQTLTPPPTKSLLLERGAPDVKIFQPEKIDPEFARRLSELAPDLFLVAAYGKIIPKKTLAIPRLGTIGVHFSLLPKYRGASPLQTAILQGEKETGVSLYLLDEKMDEGPILAYRKSQIPNRNYTEISEAFANMAGEMLIRTLPEFLAGKITPAPQVHAEASYTRKFTTADALVEPQTLDRKSTV